MPRAARLTSIVYICVAAFTLGCNSDPAPEPSGGPPRAIVLVTVDGLVPSELALFGGARESEALEQIAARGAAWDDAWTSVPMTRPAVATYLTGLAPDRHGVRDDADATWPADRPTLASRLAAAGYLTAAFPGSSHLGPASGLHAGFELVDPAPALSMGPDRVRSVTRPAPKGAENFGLWLDGLGADARAFAWLHFAEPLNVQMRDVLREAQVQRRQRRLDELGRAKGQGKGKGDAEAETDEEAAAESDPGDPWADLESGLVAVLAALERRGVTDDALVVVAGTLGDVRGGADGVPGPGLSLTPATLTVPVVVAFPSGTTAGRAAEAPLWAGDVTATILALAGAEPLDGAEGVALTEAAPADRLRFAWSWATLDRMGWEPLRAASSGGALRVEGDPAVEAGGAELKTALATRTELEPRALPVAAVASLLEAHGVTLDPAPDGGRVVADPAARRAAAYSIWLGHDDLRSGQVRRALQGYFIAEQLDEGNRESLVSRANVLALTPHQDPMPVARRASALYPGDPDALHWFAHSIWSASIEDAARLIEALLPYKAQDTDVLYDLACAKSLTGDLDASERYLRDAIGAGFRTWEHIEADADLRRLRESGRLSEVLREYRR